MRCPYCGQTKNRVVDSRTSREGRAVRRRRECQGCGERFTTYEVVEERPLSIKKRDGSFEPFDRAKLIRGIQLACKKRPVTLAQIEEIADSILEGLERSESGEVESWQIGEQVMHRLRDLDQVAYVRFASVYTNFQDPEEYLETIRDLAQRGGYDAAQLDFLESALGEDLARKSKGKKEPPE
ncbi:MAG: transcriptional repressor NrdR [Gemmatimonadetes bacterium]|uniref:Transcriptional repressor NrdR n=1 Tax=Candidatus Kutchimonas denitrificans TaxID=3056748 RepID=A0AAE4Z5H5_9BACT|nr:transcriptional repressor NrdR [Gemmatimonadota bacterium]NIR73913.1 transcriptional repressor NrdR [Candidatus Kutchimonas denitrificans]NIR99719.1 transcriptional repressor NrdR [Gemmatimonadota bacterium]NIT65304.1 transcriptional repressor NrdR [Gemmatimonadota bacterium]NIW73753.1 transcriptional repressor NrdR [Gemmatimonadota bacterium]